MPLEETEFSSLEQNVANSASALFSACIDACPNDTFYGFAFLPDEDVQSFYWMADTRASLERSSKALHKEASKAGSDQTLDEIMQIMQFACDEWAYGEETLDVPVEFDCDLGLSAIWSSFRNLDFNGDAYDEGFRSVRLKALQAIARGLKSFRETSQLDDDFISLVQVNDSSDVDEMLALAEICCSQKVASILKSLYQE